MNEIDDHFHIRWDGFDMHLSKLYISFFLFFFFWHHRLMGVF
jgi:hypothetical protein